MPRQDPGKNLTGTSVRVVAFPLIAVVLPQTHLNNGKAGVGAAPPEPTGTKLTVLPSIAVSPMPWTVTITPPAASVATDATYLDVAVELSQPQPPAAGKLAAELLWYTSVMDVRQPEAAKITSDSFARLV